MSKINAPADYSALSASSSTSSTSTVPKRVVIVGAGIGGLTAAIALKTKLDFHDFTIYEKATGLGGTWWANTYPGCACDIPIQNYSLTTDPNPEWTSPYASQPDIQAYWAGLARKYGLDSHIFFEYSVESALWKPVEQLWNIVVKNLATGTLEFAQAHVLITATGQVDIPVEPKLERLPLFKGEMFHSARWNHAVSLEGKRITVVGNGCSASQFLPHIVKIPNTKITQLCRSPSWFLPPRKNTPYTPLVRWLYRNIPFTTRYEKFLDDLVPHIMFYALMRFKATRAVIQKEITRLLIKELPEKYRSTLVPDYPLGCKRVVFDSGYLKALHEPNLDVVLDSIDSMTEDGYMTTQGRLVHSDVVIFATGFSAAGVCIPIKGLDSTLQEYYQAQGGPTAYRGTTAPGFPNFCTVFGPNMAANSPVLQTEEFQISYIMQLISPVLSGKISSFDVKAEVSERYNKDIQARLGKTVLTQCASVYRQDRNGKVISMFPGTVMSLRKVLRTPIWKDYRLDGITPQWTNEVARKRHAVVMKGLLVIPTVVWLAWALGLWSLDSGIKFGGGGQWDGIVPTVVQGWSDGPSRFFAELF